MSNPIIMTPYGPVTESARKQAALNLWLDPVKRSQVVELLADQLYAGDMAKGLAEAKRRFPEAFEPPQ